MLLPTVLLLAATLQDPSAALAPEALPLDGLAEAGRQLLLDEPGDGRVWARGRTFKASFGSDGFTYVPFLGSDAPRGYPVRFEIAEAAVGGEPLDRAAPTGASLEGRTVTLDHGAFTEVHHLTETSVEQTFVFASLPGTGDLRLRMAVTTDVRPSDSLGGFEFSTDRGGVRYGAATAIDAAGRTLALEQEWTVDGIEVVVPAGFTRRAELPLVIDPLITTFGVTSDTREQWDVDAAYDPTHATYHIVWSERESAADMDVLSVYYNLALGTLVSPAAIDISTVRWGSPSTASCLHEETFLVACQTYDGPSSPGPFVEGRTRHAGTGARGAPFHIAGPEALSPDVGGLGDDAASQWDFVVVYEQRDSPNQDYDIRAQSVSALGSSQGSYWAVAEGVGSWDVNPAISKSSGRTELGAVQHDYMVVWERRVSQTDRDIWARVIERTGVGALHAPFRAYHFSDSRKADVSVQNVDLDNGLPEPHWVIAFERLNGADLDIFAVVATDGDADYARNIADMQDLEDEQRDQRGPKIAFDGEDYVVTYQSYTPALERDLYYTALNVVLQSGELRTALAERRYALRPEDGQGRWATVASQYDGGGPDDAECLALWVENAPVPPQSNVGGATLQSLGVYSAGTQYCHANPNASGVGAWMRATSLDGVVRPNTWPILRCQDLPPNAFGYFLVSDTSAFTANAGGSAGNLCLGGAIGRYSHDVQYSGTTGRTVDVARLADLPHPFGSIAAMSGEVWHFQYWTRDIDGSGAATSNFSNAVALHVN